MKKMIMFFKKETVLCISSVLALLSMLLTPPSAEYAGYINYSVIAMLFCLMVMVQGFSSCGVFSYLSKKLLSLCSGSRQLACVLMLMCFFTSMIITNDVALITFVPLTILLFKGKKSLLIRSCILETAAANLGSMLTPLGNPQNLFLYSHYNYSLGKFLLTMLPVTLISFLLLFVSLLFLPNEKIQSEKTVTKLEFNSSMFMYICIFALCLLEVAHILDYKVCFGATIVLCLMFDRKILKKPDYPLLITFVCFFVFVGNLSADSGVREFIMSAINGNELFAAAGISQAISNVPCAVMLAGFTNEADKVLVGVNIGGMGTLIASLASLISYRFYVRSDNSSKGRYFLEFSIYNFAFLIILGIFSWFIYC